MWKTVLLDIDGTLLDSNTAHTHAWVAAFAEAGYAISFATILPLVGLGGDKLLDALTPGLKDTEGVGQEIAHRRKEIFQQQYLTTVKPTPGARQLVERIIKSGMKPVVATSAEDDELRGLLRAANVDDLIEQQANASDATGSKPDPDIILAALDVSGSSPQEAIMIGDTPFDLEAAGKADVAVLAFRSGGHDADLAGALGVYDDPADLLAQWESSPLGRRERAAD